VLPCADVLGGPETATRHKTERPTSEAWNLSDEAAIDQTANLIASKFIQRRDAKAEQRNDIYVPVTDTGRPDGKRLKWTRDDLRAHVKGERSMGHYLVGSDGNAKLFAFDIDLTQPNEKTGRDPKWVPILEDGAHDHSVAPKRLDPRKAWLHPQAPDELKRYLIAQMRETAEMLATVVMDVLGLPCAVAYSGSKGLHVYGFTGSAPAGDVRGAALEVIDYLGTFEPLRGKNFFKYTDDDPYTGLDCVDVEVYPKQDNLKGKDLGNLMRLPLGINKKSGQRAYFLNLSSSIDSLEEMPALPALNDGNPWGA
jgi:hypothetical protein